LICLEAEQNLDAAVNAVFMGTSVISGSAQMVVVATGQTSQLGHLAGQLASRRAPTNFERGVERFGLMLLRVAIVMVLFVLPINVSFDRPMLESFSFGAGAGCRPGAGAAADDCHHHPGARGAADG
jgi:Mg2+-importing ATPase